MSEMNKRIETLSEQKQKLLNQMLRKQQLFSVSEPKQRASIQRGEAVAPPQISADANAQMPLSFGLFFFADDTSEAEMSSEKYRLLLEGAKYADQSGLCAIWTPERHFHAFGGLYPNPSVLGAALAMVTQHIQIRAGSVVLPLHNPIRVAEEWSVVDNLSHGRVEVAFASGWHMDDFVFTSEPFQQRKEMMYRGIERIRHLWAGNPLTLPGNNGDEIDISLYPKPVQPQLPIWISSSGSSETFVKAGEIGAHLLTSLIGQGIDDLAQKIVLYRQSLRRHGFNPSEHKVALMLHTFLGQDLALVRETVREPMYRYLRSNLDLHNHLLKSRKTEIDLQTFTREDEQALLDYAFERYFSGSALFGTPASCLPTLKAFSAIGVDEIACLIDFGLDTEVVLEGLHSLAELNTLCRQDALAERS